MESSIINCIISQMKIKEIEMTKFKSNFPIKKNIRYKEGDYKIVSFTEYD